MFSPMKKYPAPEEIPPRMKPPILGVRIKGTQKNTEKKGSKIGCLLV